MAKQVKQFPNFYRGRAEKYPFAKWFNGKVWLLTGGRDFKTDPNTFRNYLYQKAKSFGLTIKVSVRHNLIYLQTSKSKSKTK